MSTLSVLITACGGALATVIGAWALLVKARSEAARPMQLLHRLWDWLEGTDLDGEVPEGLRGDVTQALRGGDEK